MIRVRVGYFSNAKSGMASINTVVPNSLIASNASKCVLQVLHLEHHADGTAILT